MTINTNPAKAGLRARISATGDQSGAASFNNRRHGGAGSAQVDPGCHAAPSLLTPSVFSYTCSPPTSAI